MTEWEVRLLMTERPRRMEGGGVGQRWNIRPLVVETARGRTVQSELAHSVSERSLAVGNRWPNSRRRLISDDTTFRQRRVFDDPKQEPVGHPSRRANPLAESRSRRG